MLPFARMLEYGNEIQPLPGVKKILAESSWCMVLYDNGDLYARGQNAGNTFGDGSAANSIIIGDWKLVQEGVKNVWSSLGTTFCTTLDNRVLSSGSIRGLTGSTSSSTAIFTDRTLTFTTAGVVIQDIVDMSVGPYDVYTLVGSGAIYSGGTNAYGQHGTGNVSARPYALNPNFSNIKKISSYGAQGGTFWCLDNSGTLYGTGNGSVGQLLAASATVSTKRVLSTDVIDYSASINCFFIIKSDGLYCAGSQFNGQLGDGVNSSNISTVGKTSLFKVPQFSTAPSYVINNVYMTIVRHEDKWYSCGNIAKSGGGSRSTSSTFVLNSTTVPKVSDPKWAVGDNNSYVISEYGLLHGTGLYNATTDLLPGYTVEQFNFVQLSTNGI